MTRGASTAARQTHEPQARLRDVADAGAVAIVGIGCRYPGVTGPSELWKMLLEGRCAVDDVPASRWDKNGVFDAEKPIPRRGAFLEDVRSFDAQFFNIAPREAEQMDPQQRIMLEVAWEALEDAGCNPRRLAGSRTGVYVGALWHDYEIVHARSGATHTAHSAVGQSVDVIATRVSFALGLQGPSLVVNTGCSASLVALHLACQALRSGECVAALVGGTNVMLSPDVMVGLTRFGGLAPDGLSKAFSAAANGFGRGEGVAVVMLRPLDAALADGDRIYSVIRATGVNNDGGGRQLTAPSMEGQKLLLQELYAGAGIDPASVQYVEAHGTGTPVGDPIEARAMGEVFGRGRAPDRRLRVGSIKTNLGHQEGGAGVAGLIKAALSLHHGQIPPSLHSEPLNPSIDFERLGLQVQTELGDWEPTDGPPIAGVSSFGWGGTNAHAILQAAPTPARELRPASPRPARVLLVSAASSSSLRRRATEIAALLDRRPEAIDAICANLAARRAHLSHRLALVGAPESLAGRLARFAGRGELGDEAAGEGEQLAEASGVAPATERKVVFVFPGQGSQWLAMGRVLIEQEPVFAAAVARCEEALREFVDWSLHSVLSDPADDAWLESVDVIQCSLWAMQVSLAELWRSWGVEPHAVVGHSMGEVAAACVAGAISLRDGARIMSNRSRLARRRSGAGGMLHVALSARQAEEIVRGKEALVAVAVCSSPRATVLSGDLATLAQIEQALTDREIFCAPVRVDYASHSPQMDGLLDELREVLAPVAPSACSVPMYSTSLARLVAGEELAADYWAMNLRNPVRFADVVQALTQDGHEVFVEVSPHPVLVSSIEETLEAAELDGKAIATLRREHGGRDQMLARLCDLHASGAAIRWEDSALIPDAPAIDLPRYPWEHDSHWLGESGAAYSSRSGGRHALIRGLLPVAGPGRVSAVMARLAVQETGFLNEHRVHDVIVFPAAGHVDLILAAAAEAYPDREWAIEDMSLDAALALSTEEARAVQVLLEEKAPDLIHFTVASALEGDEAAGWTRHVRGRLTAMRTVDEAELPGHGEALRPLEVPSYYQSLLASGLDHGPSFRGIQTLSVGPGCAEGLIEAPESLSDQLAMYRVHPALLDAALQLSLAAAPAVDGRQTRIPVRVGCAKMHRPWPRRVQVTARSRASDLDPDSHAVSVLVRDPDGALVMEIEGLELAPLASREDSAGDGNGELMVECVWRPAPRRPQEETREPGMWGVLDLSGHGEALCRELERAGETAGLAAHVPGRESGRAARVGAEQSPVWQTDFRLSESTEAWLAWLGRHDGPPLRGVVLLGLFDGDSNREPDWPLAETLVMVVARVTEALGALERTPRPRLVVVTTATQGGHYNRPEWAALWGAGRAIDIEHPDVPCTRIDVDGGEGSLFEVASEIVCGDIENEVAFRGGERHVARLEHPPVGDARDIAASRQSRISARHTSYHVETLAPGSLDGLAVRATDGGEVPDHLIRVEVEHAALNFADLLKAMGIFPGLDPHNVELGLECSGRIVAVGRSAACDLAVGDEVVATPFHAFQSHADVLPADVIRKPADLSMQQAAAYPCAYMTAWYGLHHLARVRAGERILIHSAAGGLGLAAIQVARQAGLEIFATAGNEQKRSYLRSLGVEHVFDSRSLSFVKETRRHTDGEGVDVVLNCLSGELLEASVSLLRFAGRFLEVGKRDIYSDSKLGLHHFRNAIGFHAIDLENLHEKRPERWRQLLEEVTHEIAGGRLPPLPVECFEVSSVRQAFDRMARAEHVGKIVLDMKAAEVEARALPGGRVRADGAYIVSGGLGALGRAAGEWLASRGARHIVLLGRSEPSPEANEAMLRMRASGAQVEIVQCDVASWSALRSALVPALAGRPVRGVLHAAGVLDDATLGNLTAEKIARVFRPKVQGAWNLHLFTERMPVDFFVLYSSVAALFGSAGQVAYSAANSCLDALAHHRLRRGLPATSINWGPVAEVGLAASSDVRGNRLAARGLEGLSLEQVTAALEQSLAQGWPQVAMVRLDADAWRRSFPAIADLPRWSVLLPSDDAAAPQLQAELRARLQAEPLERRADLLEGAIRALLALVLRLPEERIARTTPFGNMGLDSLLGLELRNRLERALGDHLPATLLWRYSTLERLAPALLERAGLLDDAVTPRAVRAAAPLPRTREPGPEEKLAQSVSPQVPEPEDLLSEEQVTSTGVQLLAEFEAELARSSLHLQGE